MLWIVAAVLPALLSAIFVYRIDKEREPIWLVSLTFVLGGGFAALAHFAVSALARFMQLSSLVGDRGETGSLLFLFAIVAPLQEVLKVAAAWPAFRSRHFDEPFDGLVYASMAGLGFAAIDTTLLLVGHANGVWAFRTLLALPAHWFFACGWGYALGRVGDAQGRRAFPRVFVGATLGHAFYTHLVYGRGAGVLIAVIPMLLAMAIVVWIAGRDLRIRGERVEFLPPSIGQRLTRLPLLKEPPTFESVRDALRRGDHPIMLRWIVIGTFVTLGTMIAGLFAAVGLGRVAELNFALLDERDAASAAALALLGAGVLAAFPLAGFLVARAAGLPTLLESALGAGTAIAVTLIFFGLAAQGALVFAVAFAPIAWGLACLGAWVGRPKHHA